MSLGDAQAKALAMVATMQLVALWVLLAAALAGAMALTGQGARIPWAPPAAGALLAGGMLLRRLVRRLRG